MCTGLVGCGRKIKRNGHLKSLGFYKMLLFLTKSVSIWRQKSKHESELEKQNQHYQREGPRLSKCMEKVLFMIGYIFRAECGGRGCSINCRCYFVSNRTMAVQWLRHIPEGTE